MAQPTTQHPQQMQSQHSTPGVGQTGQQPAPGSLASMRPAEGGPRQTPDTPGAEPVLFDDIDPVLLARLYPDAMSKGIGEARDLAMAAGHAAHDLGAKLMAAAQEPVAVPAEPGAAPPPPMPH